MFLLEVFRGLLISHFCLKILLSSSWCTQNCVEISIDYVMLYSTMLNNLFLNLYLIYLISIMSLITKSEQFYETLCSNLTIKLHNICCLNSILKRHVIWNHLSVMGFIIEKSYLPRMHLCNCPVKKNVQNSWIQ